jgi:NTP pyrophosphatase (non-canonical NTP hydrolase)
MEFQKLVGRTMEVVREFEKVEKRPWGVEGEMMELSKQTGEVAMRIMMLEGYYMAGRDRMEEYRTSKADIADELSDVLLCVIRIANDYGIDLEKEHLYRWTPRRIIHL